MQRAMYAQVALHERQTLKHHEELMIFSPKLTVSMDFPFGKVLTFRKVLGEHRKIRKLLEGDYNWCLPQVHLGTDAV